MLRDYKYPVWGTQGGGLVREVNGTFIFVEKPDCPPLDVGDEMPQEWGTIPANELARQKDESDMNAFDDGPPQFDMSVPWHKDPNCALERMPDRLSHRVN